MPYGTSVYGSTPYGVVSLSFDIAAAVDEVTQVNVVVSADRLTVYSQYGFGSVSGSASVSANPVTLYSTLLPSGVVADTLLSFDIASSIDAGSDVLIPADIVTIGGSIQASSQSGGSIHQSGLLTLTVGTRSVTVETGDVKIYPDTLALTVSSGYLIKPSWNEVEHLDDSWNYTESISIGLWNDSNSNQNGWTE